MAPSSQSSMNLLLLCALPLISAQTNTSNTTESPFRNIQIGIKTSNLWLSGSTDNLYFQICDSSQITDCLSWYLIENGLPNRGDWYYYNYTNISRSFTPVSFKLLTQGNDQLCITAVSIDDDTVTASGDCIEVSDSRDPQSCDVIDVDFVADTIINTDYTSGPDFCPYDVSDAIVAPPTPTANGTRTYDLALEVSAFPYAGTNNDLYLRLCADSARTDCTKIAGTDDDEWFVFGGGLAEDAGVTYTAAWNTKDIGDVAYADVVIFGSDDFCLSSLRVDDITADAGTLPECISNSEDGGCSTLAIDLANEEFADSESDSCAYGILNNNTDVYVTDYIFTFKTGSVVGCGCGTTVYFMFCSADGYDFTYSENNDYCSEVYEIGGQMDEYAWRYDYTVSIEEYEVFNTISDVYSVFVWTSTEEYWCLSDIWIDGITADGEEVTGANADSTPATSMDTNIDNDEFCNGVRVTFSTGEWYEFSDGPTASGSNGRDLCRFKDKIDEEGTIKVSTLSSGTADFIDWMNDGYNWIYICVGLIGLVICCICCCAVLQKMKVKSQVVDTNQPWHGGRTY